MEHSEVPHKYMTVGEVAKKMGVSVRTLQYYDRADARKMQPKWGAELPRTARRR